MSIPERAASRLLESKEEIAREVTAALHERMPDLLRKHGERGREKCLQDMRYNVEHLAPAVHLERPDMFEGYVRWLDEMLGARGVDTAEIVVCLELLDEAVARGFEEEEAAVVRSCVRAGLGALRGAEYP
jgi:MerR family transcriptional regulator, light-induced transcriptional regulator